MKPIKTKVFDNEIDRLIDYSFDVASDGLYTIKITASAKAWWQHIVSPRLFLKKDSLAVRLDGEDSVPIVTKKKLNADDMWNGNVLKGHEMTLYIHVSLKEGNHTLSFVPRGKPFLDTVSILQIADNMFSLANLTPLNRDRIPWITFLFHKTVIVSNVSITATAEKRKGDDDDLQIRFDGMIERNETPRAHRDWFWCGKVLRGTAKTFTKDFTKNSQPTRFDILVDGTPMIESLSLKLTEDTDVLMGRIALYQDIETAQEVNMRKDKNTASPIVAKLKNGEKLKILERIAVGENVLNKSNIWHKVYYKGETGYVLSSFVEIVGEEREQVIHSIKEHAKKHGVDENLATSLAGCESRYKPYAVSFSRARGIFQLTEIAIEDLATRFDFVINENEIFHIEKNIEGGIRYLKWIIDSYRDTEDFDKKIVAAWNAGKSLIPIKGRINLSHIPTSEKRAEAEKLITCVLKNRKKKDWRFIMPLFLFFLLIVSAGVYALEKQYIHEPKLDTMHQTQSYRTPRFAFYDLFDGVISSLFFYDMSLEEFEHTTLVQYTIDGVQRNLELSGYIVNASFLGGMDFSDFLFVAREEGHQILTSLFRYDRNVRDLVLVPFIETDGHKSTDLCCAYITHQPRKYGLEYDVVMYDYHRYTSLPPTKKVYEYSYHQEAYVAQ